MRPAISVEGESLHIGLVDEMVGSDLLFARAAHGARQVAEFGGDPTSPRLAAELAGLRRT
ncbi:MAG: hypothetical protein WCF04_09385 [Candidatus Nanopelagicales bacterium]